jgi:hypothetical protein
MCRISSRRPRPQSLAPAAHSVRIGGRRQFPVVFLGACTHGTHTVTTPVRARFRLLTHSLPLSVPLDSFVYAATRTCSRLTFGTLTRV